MNIPAVLVRLSISAPGNTQENEEMTEEYKNSKGMSGDVGAWHEKRLPAEAMHPLNSAIGKIRKRHYGLTTPWEKGFRILLTAAQPRYDADITQQGTDEFQAAQTEWLAAYPGWVEQVRIMKNGTFKPSDYPPAEAFRSLFKWKMHYLPFPKADHFVESISESAREEMRASLESTLEARVNAAVTDVWQRLLDPVQKIADRLSNPDAKIYDSLIENVRDIVARVPLLNLTGNATLSRAAREIEQRLASLDPEALRRNPMLRQQAATQASELAARFGSLGFRRFAEAA